MRENFLAFGFDRGDECGDCKATPEKPRSNDSRPQSLLWKGAPDHIIAAARRRAQILTLS